MSDAIGPVGFIGLGQIGTPIATHWLDRPAGLTVFDLRPEAAAPLVDRGARLVGSIAEVAVAADLVSIMVMDDDQVRMVVAELLDHLRPGAIVAVHSTIRPGTAETLAEEVASVGATLIDAPVTGGVLGATAGRLAVMVGGERSAYERVKEPFSAFAEVVVHAGPAGAGTQLKLARNLLQFVSFTAAGEAQRLAEAAGIDLAKLGRVVRHSDSITGGPGAVILRETTAPMEADDPWWSILAHTRSLGQKDLDLAIELGEQLGVDLPMARYSRHAFGPGLGLEPTTEEEQT